ncbi:hypothetical protein AVEN_199587-1 [Araneus ventricosus]|uniref:Uncharacterized protein n=1 Tax=Araneus ventricosus TaxID=182803 RepID=A0A4Y2J0T2_ARAVE|nr:hypothetical protein AVEN_199587-1 [Araneus ventricosus]
MPFCRGVLPSMPRDVKPCSASKSQETNHTALLWIQAKLNDRPPRTTSGTPIYNRSSPPRPPSFAAVRPSSEMDPKSLTTITISPGKQTASYTASSHPQI